MCQFNYVIYWSVSLSHLLLIYIPLVVAFYNDNSWAGPHHRSCTQRLRIVVQKEGIDEGFVCCLEKIHMLIYYISTNKQDHHFFFYLNAIFIVLTVNVLPHWCSSAWKINTWALLSSPTAAQFPRVRSAGLMNWPIPNMSFLTSTTASLSLHSTATVAAGTGYLSSTVTSAGTSGLGSSGYTQVSGFSNVCFDCWGSWGFCLVGSLWGTCLGYVGFEGLSHWASQKLPSKASATRHTEAHFITMASQQRVICTVH